MKSSLPRLLPRILTCGLALGLTVQAPSVLAQTTGQPAPPAPPRAPAPTAPAAPTMPPEAEPGDAPPTPPTAPQTPAAPAAPPSETPSGPPSAESKPAAPPAQPAPVASAPPPQGAGVPAAAPGSGPPPAYQPPSPAEKQGRRGLYARAFAEVVGYGHAADYQYDEGGDVEQTLAGGGYGLGFMLAGSPRPNFALGGAILFEHIVSAHVEIDEEDSPGSDDSVYSFSAGPSVDYFPSQYFHVGGMLALAAARIPDLDGTSGYGSAFGTSALVWVGFDFPLSEELAAGILLTARFTSLERDLGSRNIDEHESGEGGASLGLGATLLSF